MISGTMRAVLWKPAIFAATLFLQSDLPQHCAAQSIFGLKVGQPSTVLSRLGVPIATNAYKGMTVTRWKLTNGNELSVTIGNNSKVVYVESDWDGKDADSGIDFNGLHFGQTTLTELRKRFGSNGFEYNKKGPGVETQDGIVMLNSYDAGGVVVTFYTKINREEFQRAKKSGANPLPADYAKLDAISISDDQYAKDEWGSRVYDPAYKKIVWK